MIGLPDAKRLMEDIPNKIVNYLGIVEDVNLLTEGKKEYIEIVVTPSNVPVAYRGAYHYRSGSTKQELNPNRSLEKVSCHFLMTAVRKTALYMLDL